MRLKNPITILLYLIYSSAICQISFHPGSIIFEDGTEIHGLIDIPSGPIDLYINYRADENSNVVSYPSLSILGVSITYGDQVTIFERRAIDTYNPRKNTIKTKKSKRWLRLSYWNESICVYSSGSSYTMNSNGDLVTRSSDIQTQYQLEYYARKLTEDNALLLFEYQSDNPQNQKFNQNLSYYLQDDFVLAQRIAVGEFPWQELLQVVELYDSNK